PDTEGSLAWRELGSDSWRANRRERRLLATAGRAAAARQSGGCDIAEGLACERHIDHGGAAVRSLGGARLRPRSGRLILLAGPRSRQLAECATRPMVHYAAHSPEDRSLEHQRHDQLCPANLSVLWVGGVLFVEQVPDALERLLSDETRDDS